MSTYHQKQKALWLTLLKFPATPEHLEAWTHRLEKAVKYGETLAKYNHERLLPLWQQSRKHPTKTVEVKTHNPALKAVWLEHMGFAPTSLQLALFQADVERECGLDEYWKKVTVETLFEVVREVALPAAAAPAQPNLNLAGAK